MKDVLANLKCSNNGVAEEGTAKRQPCNCNFGFSGDHCEKGAILEDTAALRAQFTGGTPLNIAQLDFSGEWTENMNTGSEYKIVLNQKTWAEARDACKSYSTDGYTSSLVSIETVEERNWLNSRINFWPTPQNGFWIGCNDLGSEGDFSWVADPYRPCNRNQPEYKDWQAGEPNDQSQENCAVMMEGGWQDWWCGSAVGFVCERAKAPCFGVDCANNGRCIPSEDNESYECRCNEGFGGNDCEDEGTDASPPVFMSIELSAGLSKNQYMNAPGLRLSWHDARDYCTTYSDTDSSVDLVAFDTQAEQDAVIQTLGLRGVRFWIGCNDLESEGNTEGRFFWAGQDSYKSCTKGESGVYSNWLDDEPNSNGGRDEDCTAIRDDGGWADWSCDVGLEFICEATTKTACFEVDCSNHGRCTPADSGYTCNCNTGHTGDQCETPYTSGTDLTTGTVYMTVPDKALSWNEAREFCQQLPHDAGTAVDLVAFETQKEEANVRDMFQLFGKEFWIGCNDLVSEGNIEGSFSWAGQDSYASCQKGESGVHSNWRPGEPNNYYAHMGIGEHCTLVTAEGLWNDVVCDRTYGFVCEQQPAKVDAPCDATDCSGNGCLQPSTDGTPPYCECNADYTGERCEILTKPYIGGPPHKVYMTVPGVTKSWEDARKFCVAQSKVDYPVDLVTFSDPDEQVQVTELLNLTNQQFWIGCNDRTTEGTFVWAGQDAYKSCMPNEDGVHANWYPGEPNNWNNEKFRPATDEEEGEDCVTTYGPGKWSDAPCTGSFLFICEQSIKNECFNVDCSGHGDCIRNGDNTGFSCTCTPGYTGGAVRKLTPIYPRNQDYLHHLLRLHLLLHHHIIIDYHRSCPTGRQTIRRCHHANRRTAANRR